MVLRKRQNAAGLPRCGTEGLDGEGEVSIKSPSINDSCKSDQEHATNVIGSSAIDGYTCDNETLQHNIKMQTTASIFARKSDADSSTSSKIGTAFRLCLTFVVIIIFTVCLTQIQNVEAQHRNPQAHDEKIPNAQIENWALSFGKLLHETAWKATGYDTLEKKFAEEGAKTVKVDGFKMVQSMAASIEAMMQHKIDAIKRIMENAEDASQGHTYEPKLGELLATPLYENGYHYLNAKKINILDEEFETDSETGKAESYWDRAYDGVTRQKNDDRFMIGHTRIKLEANKHFSGIPVNVNASSVHVPTNVYDGDPKVINAIKWSEKLNKIFSDNYKRDPSLSWQFFGSSTGFMRQFPAMKWRTDEHDPDLYDARMRDWYIKSAASPKEIVILLDTSGSMTGLRKEIAKHVVLNILETLSEDDFVTVYSFSKTPRPLVECFSTGDERAELVQATPENLREFQEAVTKVKTEEIANFSSALTAAFELLIESRNDPVVGANCNQAIMLVTDGVPEREEQVFKEYNSPHKPVRVFTYLIGREISDLKAANWMACHNKGYFTHVTTLAEVKEQVLKYIPVMARPMVMYREKHPIQWTGVYADIEVPTNAPDLKPRWMIQLPVPIRRSEIFEDAEQSGGRFTGYRLMTSVSIPVFDRKNHTTLENLGLKASASPELALLRKVRIAELLGVAGTDVPISEIEKLTPPDQLGVNGYSFAVNNNGYVLYHPDLRPMFQEILKPNYNSVDLAEVELIDNMGMPEPRSNDTELLAMRKGMIDQNQGVTYLKVKQHFDFMKRATVRTQDYFYHQISNTPFSLGIALPRDYGKYRVDGQVEVALVQYNVSEKLTGTSWRIHPDWVYCEYNYAGDSHEFDSPEEGFKHFIAKMQQKGWTWGTQRVVPLPQCQGDKYEPHCQICNKELVQGLVFDAQVTQNFAKDSSRGGQRKGAKNGNVTYKEFGIRLAFVATRSGLLRYADHSALFEEIDKKRREAGGQGRSDPDVVKEPHFADINNKATDETWYKRAVDYKLINEDAFVYSIPFDVGEKPTSVTATRALVVGKGNEKAPVAVVGMQIDYDIFYQKFFEETNRCDKTSARGGRTQNGDCTKTCNSTDLECYVIDNNGFIVISEQRENTGKFFGEVDGTIFESLIQHQIFKPIKIYDYQAICLEMMDDGSPASIMLTPFKLFAMGFNWIISQIAWTIIRFEIHHLWDPDWTYAFPQEYQPNQQVVSDNNGPSNGVEVEDVEYEDETPFQTGEEEYEDYEDPLMDQFSIKDGGPIPLLAMTYINKTTPKPCDKEVTLYELNNAKFYRHRNRQGKLTPVKGKLSHCSNTNGCERPFSVQMIPHTNLIMIVADTNCPCVNKVISITPTKIEYGAANETAYCDKLKYNIYRKKPKHCMNYHAEETEIKLCGRASYPGASPLLLIVCVLLRYIFLGPSLYTSGNTRNKLYSKMSLL